MPFIPRQVKPPARLAITCKLPEAVATLLKHYAAFLDSTQEYVIAETLQLAFRKDKEFQAWLASHDAGTSLVEADPQTDRPDASRPSASPRPRSTADGRVTSGTALPTGSADASARTAERQPREGSLRL